MLEKGVFPEHLKLAKVFPLFKKDDKSNITDQFPYFHQSHKYLKR